MLAGCSSSALVSPRHRLRSEASAQFQACHFQLPSMNKQRLDLPCSFSRKDTSRSQPIRPVGLSVDKPIESKRSCSLKQNIRLPPLATRNNQIEIKDKFWEKGKSLKRFAEGGLVDESCINRAKRKKGSSDNDGKNDDIHESGDNLSLGQLSCRNFWFQQSFTGQHVPQLPLTCSGEDDRVCFVPSDLISPPLPLSKIPWVESIVTEITDLGEKDVDETRHRVTHQVTHETRHRPAKEVSASSNSSESHNLALGPHENPVEHDMGNGSKNPYPQQGGVEASEEDKNQWGNQGFELVSLLTACVEAIGRRNIHAINHYIAKLGDLASPRGSSISRLCAYYTEALALRVARLWPHTFHINPPRDLDQLDDDSGIALRLLNQVTPILKFIHFTSNEMLLRAFDGKDRVHIIDFDIKQGLQWPSLFQSLASRSNPPSHVRITGIGESKQELNETGDRLYRFAEALNLPFEFHPVVDRLEDVRLWMLHVKEKESVAVNCVFQLHKTLYSGNGGALRDFLGLIRSTNPTIVIMTEQEAENNSPTLETRVSNSLKHYAAIFDMIDSSLPLDSPVRLKIEEMFAREIRNIVACEGNNRYERHECFKNWRRMMEQGGFRCMRISQREMLQSQMLLKMYSCEHYGVKKQVDGVALTLSWMDQPLYTVSAWAPVDVAGSSSSFS